MFSTSKHLLFLFPKSCMLCQQKCFFRGCNVFFQWKKNSFQLYHHIWWTINSNSLEQCQWAKKDNSNFKSKTWTWKKTIILLRKSRSQDVKSYCLLSICSHSYTCCILKLYKIMKYLSHVLIQLICAKDVTISTQEPLSYASVRRVVNFNRSPQTDLNQVTDKNVEIAFLIYLIRFLVF